MHRKFNQKMAKGILKYNLKQIQVLRKNVTLDRCLINT